MHSVATHSNDVAAGVYESRGGMWFSAHTFGPFLVSALYGPMLRCTGSGSLADACLFDGYASSIAYPAITYGMICS